MEPFEIEKQFVFTKEDVQRYLRRDLSDVEWQAVAEWMCDGFEAYLESDLENISDTDFTKVVSDWKMKNIV